MHGGDLEANEALVMHLKIITDDRNRDPNHWNINFQDIIHQIT